MDNPLESKIENLIKENKELKFAYQTLETGYQRYWEFFNFAPDGYLVTDNAGIIKEANQTFLAMLSAKPSDLLERPLTAMFPEIKQDDLRVQLNWFGGSQSLEVFLHPQNRPPFYASLSIAPQCNALNKRIGLLWLIRDISAQKEAEKVLRRNEQFNSSLLMNSPNPILVINPDTSIAYTNPAFEALTGIASDQIIGRKAPYPWWIDQDSSRTLETFKKILNKLPGKQEEYFRKKNGDYFWVEVNTIAIKSNEAPDNYLQTWVDITGARHLRENLEYYMVQITRAQEEERKRIAQELHEETVQSLAALCLSVESIIKSEKSNSPETDNKLQSLQKIRGQINQVIEQVRKFSYGLRPGVLDYLGLTATLDSFVDDLNDQGLQVRLAVSGKERPLPQDLEITLFRIVQEAINNIKKHSQAEQVSIAINYGSSKIRLTIDDNGRGFQIPESLSELAVQGKLGLIGIQQRTRLYGGSFEIESQPQKGTRLRILLPANRQSHLCWANRPE